MSFRARQGRDGTLNQAQRDIEDDNRRRDSNAALADSDQIVTFSGNYTAKPQDRCLVFRDATAGATLLLPGAAAWGRRRSVLIRIANRTGQALYVQGQDETSGYTVAAGLNSLAWWDGLIYSAVIA